MPDFSQISDEDILKAAGLPPQAMPAQPQAGDPYSHISDADILKYAGVGQEPKAGPAQNESFWREPLLAASNAAKGAISTWAHAMDAGGTAQGVPAQAALNVMSELGLSNDKPKPLTDAVINNQAKNEALFRDAGIIDRPDLTPQGFGERALAAGSQGLGSTASMGMVNPGALASGFSSGVGAQVGHEVAPDSAIAPLVGSLVGGAAPTAIGAVGSKLLNAGKNALGAYDPSVRADEIIAKKLTADGVDPSQIEQTMRQFPDKPLTIADLGGKATQRIARASLDVPGDASGEAAQLLQDRDLGAGVNGEFDMMRQGGTADRVAADIKKALGSDDAFKTIDELVAQGDANSAPLYQKFYEQPATPARQVQQFMTSPTFRSAVNRANASLLDEGQKPLTDYIDFNEAGDPVNVTGKAFPPQTLDRIKQGVDDNWLAARASGDRGAIRTANSLRTRYLSFLDAKYPDTYAQARAAFAGPAASRDAIQQGMEVFQNTPEEVASTLKALPPENQDMFRLGVQKALIGKVMNTADGANEVRAIFGNPAKRASVAAAFDDPKALNDLSQSLGIENRMFATKNIAGGSRTAPSIMDQQDLGTLRETAEPVLAGGAHLASGNVAGALMHFAKPAFNALATRLGEGANGETTNLLAQRLFNPDAAQNADRLALVQALMNNPGPQSAPNAMAFLPYLSGLSTSANAESRR